MIAVAYRFLIEVVVGAPSGALSLSAYLQVQLHNLAPAVINSTTTLSSACLIHYLGRYTILHEMWMHICLLMGPLSLW